VRFQIFSKVRIADLIEPREGLSRSQWQSAFNRIACKHADFVLRWSFDSLLPAKPPARSIHSGKLHEILPMHYKSIIRRLEDH
jgi:hypothetical protein